jgi:hypothetical protein
MNKDIKWKEHLLKSGIPLEYEIKEYLLKNGCIPNFEYTYLRENETKQTTEFSYDIDSSFIKPPYFIDFMIECKYRHESTKWLFLPEEYGGIDEVEYTSFIHQNDHFNSKRHSNFSNFPFPLAPLCSKGIELTNEGQNPKTITQAISQLSYAMAEKITNGIYHQIDEVLSKNFGGTLFCNIPIIVTTAELYRINENVTIDKIKNSTEIEEIATNQKCLVIKNNIGVDLEKYNLSVFQDFVSEIGKDKLSEKLNSFNKDLEFVLSVIAKNYCPQCLIVIHYSKIKNGFDDLISYLKKYMNPDKEVLDAIKQKEEEMNERLKILTQKMKRNNS